jgi:hypothetical protein
MKNNKVPKEALEALKKVQALKQSNASKQFTVDNSPKAQSQAPVSKATLPRSGNR